MLTVPRTPSLTVEVSFIGETAECVIFGGLDSASTPVLAGMLTLVLDKHPRKLVLRTSGTRPTDRAAQMIADIIKLLPTAARPVILRRSPPVRGLPRQTGPHTVLQAESLEAFRGNGAGRSRSAQYPSGSSSEEGSR